MKIAIVAPSPVPFTIGGVENLVRGLCETINDSTKHQADIIKLPSREHDFWSLVENYYNYYKLDLSHFDLVITTKYPSWMVQHKNSICYMIHTLRGLYDTYHFMNISLEVKRGTKEIDKVLDYMKFNKKVESLDEFFEILFDLRHKSNKLPCEFFKFPGAFIREIIHYLDSFALSRNGVKEYFCISKTVMERKEYFPTDAKVKVVYPPSNFKNVTCGDYKYVFMVSRLDSPKRIEMLIRAMKHVKSDIKLYIAGTGPQSKELKKLAEGDHRIDFLGFINDEEVEEYYANSLVVPYFPYDEDYGLITIEAMLHKKPVITTIDSGGPTEFVVNNETGYITKFDERAIAEKIDFFAKNPLEARRMGENAYNKVIGITWSNVVAEILDCNVNDNLSINSKINKRKREKITVVTTYPIYPPLNGGQARIFNLYKILATEFDVEIITLASADEKPFEREISNGLWEIRIPKTLKHQEDEWNIEKKIGVPISDVGAISLMNDTPIYEEKLRKSLVDSKLVVLSHPYLYNTVKGNIENKPLVYEAHNVEYIMKKEMYASNSTSKGILKELFVVEKSACLESDMIWTCSKGDQLTINKLYGIPFDKMLTVPNGVDCSTTLFQSVMERLKNKKEMGLNKETLAIFVGSWHKPNLEACEEIFKIAIKCPDVKFLIMGSQCNYFKSKNLPDNVGMLGVVSEETKKKIFSVVDFALNPMMSGSGTNLKMFDYMAAGIPIITTEFGTRGIDDKSIFIVSEINNMASIIQNFNLEEQDKMVLEAEQYTKNNFDWCVIGNKLIKQIQNIIN